MCVPNIEKKNWFLYMRYFYLILSFAINLGYFFWIQHQSCGQTSIDQNKMFPFCFVFLYLFECLGWYSNVFLKFAGNILCVNCTLYENKSKSFFKMRRKKSSNDGKRFGAVKRLVNGCWRRSSTVLWSKKFDTKR